jgi:hypothetical protein
MAKVVAICSSLTKGVRKDNIKKGVLRTGYGLEGDAHADSGWHRQVSLLSMESIAKAREMGIYFADRDSLNSGRLRTFGN